MKFIQIHTVELNSYNRVYIVLIHLYCACKPSQSTSVSKSGYMSSFLSADLEQDVVPVGQWKRLGWDAASRRGNVLLWWEDLPTAAQSSSADCFHVADWTMCSLSEDFQAWRCEAITQKTDISDQTGQRSISNWRWNNEIITRTFSKGAEHLVRSNCESSAIFSLHSEVKQTTTNQTRSN